jgi:hypothetical protein
MQLVKNFESSAAADSARLYSTLPQRSHRLAHSFPNDSSSLTEAQVERAQRKQQWLSSVEQFFVPVSGAGGGAVGNETELDDVGTDSGGELTSPLSLFLLSHTHTLILRQINLRTARP